MADMHTSSPLAAQADPRRRTLLRSLAAVSTLLPAWALATEPAATPERFRQALVDRLTQELGDRRLAEIEAGYLSEIFFDWSVPHVQPQQVQSIVAFGFGNGSSPGDKTKPAQDPNTVAIAAATFQLYRARRRPVYAEQAIAQRLQDHHSIHPDDLHGLAAPPPAHALMAALMQPALPALADTLLSMAGGAQALGQVAIVTHRDQAKLAVQVLRGKGVEAAVPSWPAPPEGYDPQAASPVFRQREIYLLYNASLQLGGLRQALIHRKYPQG